MQFGVLAGNQHINSRIYAMFETIDGADIKLFVRKFRSERDTQLFHTFRELVVGSHLRTHGMDARYERKVCGMKPDWVIYDSSNEIQELIDVVSLHQRKETETEMVGTLSTGAVWAGWMTMPPNHLYAKIEKKASLYASLAQQLQKPYTVFLFGEFLASVDPEEIEHVLHELHGGLFSSHSTLAGVVYFTESSGIYSYYYYPNKKAAFQSPAIKALGSNPPVAA